MTSTSNTLEPVLSFLHQYAPFNQMLPVHQEYLAMYLEQEFYAESDPILSSENGIVDSFYIIKQGSVSGEANLEKATLKSSPVRILKSGDSFPIAALLSNRAVNFQHHAIKSTICYKLKQSHFEYLMQQSTVFHNYCVSQIPEMNKA